MKILWLCSWYPNKIKAFEGDFIQRHAQAVATLHEIYVIHVVKDTEGKITRSIFDEVVTNGNLTEKIIYYKPRNTGVKLADRLLSAMRRVTLYKSAVKKYLARNPQCKMAHVHVAITTGSIALWAKRKYKIPYIVSEHWSAFLPQAIPNANELPSPVKAMLARVFKKASAVTTVSRVLANAIDGRFDVPDISIVPNVVNTDIFFPVSKSASDPIQFLHVSTLSLPKNIEQVLQACSMVKKKSHSFILNLFVPDIMMVHDLVIKYELEGFVNIHTEVPQAVLAKTMQLADALILYSSYETFGCVVIESNACGVPAILSDLPVFKEHSVENETALFIELNNIDQLAEAMIKFIDHSVSFNSEAIAERTEARFGFKIIAAKFDEIYRTSNSNPS